MWNKCFRMNFITANEAIQHFFVEKKKTLLKLICWPVHIDAPPTMWFIVAYSIWGGWEVDSICILKSCSAWGSATTFTWFPGCHAAHLRGCGLDLQAAPWEFAAQLWYFSSILWEEQFIVCCLSALLMSLSSFIHVSAIKGWHPVLQLQLPLGNNRKHLLLVGFYH